MPQDLEELLGKYSAWRHFLIQKEKELEAQVAALQRKAAAAPRSAKSGEEVEVEGVVETLAASVPPTEASADDIFGGLDFSPAPVVEEADEEPVADAIAAVSLPAAEPQPAETLQPAKPAARSMLERVQRAQQSAPPAGEQPAVAKRPSLLDRLRKSRAAKEEPAAPPQEEDEGKKKLPSWLR